VQVPPPASRSLSGSWADAVRVGGEAIPLLARVSAAEWSQYACAVDVEVLETEKSRLTGAAAMSPAGKLVAVSPAETQKVEFCSEQAELVEAAVAAGTSSTRSETATPVANARDFFT